jgi:hypothetical protein
MQRQVVPVYRVLLLATCTANYVSLRMETFLPLTVRKNAESLKGTGQRSWYSDGLRVGRTRNCASSIDGATDLSVAGYGAHSPYYSNETGQIPRGETAEL